MTPRVLIVQTQSQTAQFLARFFEERGDEVTIVLDLGQAAAKLAQYKPDLMVLDLHFPGDEWQTFLSLIRAEYPDLNIVITSKYPDVDRELKAQELGIRAFVRHPFTLYSLNKALDVVGLSSTSETVLSPTTAAPPVQTSRTRISVGLKVTIPLLLLALFIALAAAFVVSQAVVQSAQNRFETRLAETRLLAADAMVREEESLLRPLRLITNVQGVSELTRDGDAERLRLIISPLLDPAEEELVEILGPDGISILSAMSTAGGNRYDYSRGRDVYQNEPFVRATLFARADQLGDKHAGVVNVDNRLYFFVSGAVYDENDRIIGAALVGRSLESLTTRLQQDTLSRVTFYDQNGQPLFTTLFNLREIFPLAQAQVQDLLGETPVPAIIRELQIEGVSYSEVVAPWRARGDLKLGLLSVAVPQDYLVRGGQLARLEVFGLVAAGLLLVILVGFYLTGLITAPLRSLAQASAQIAQGDLDVKLDESGSDEVAAVAHTFNYMVTGLQEGMVYRDLLGQSASPLLREHLRQSLSSGNLRLEGQEVVATVLTSAVSGFTDMAEKVNDPVRVFEWLNEYFSQIVPIVSANAGVINKFDGDVMVAFFGILPRITTPRESALSACEAAVDILQAVDGLNSRRLERGDPPMITNIGIHTGALITGGLGSGDRVHFTLMGEAVSITRRLELLGRDVIRTNSVLISQPTFAALHESGSQFNLEPIGLHPVKDNAEKILVYRLLSPVADSVSKVRV